MQILTQNFGSYRTNCYILKHDAGELIIDPGEGAARWVIQNVTRPLALLCTHGHFDHTFDAARLKNELGVRIFIHEADVFMLQHDIFNAGVQLCEPDVIVRDETWLEVGGVRVKFHHFAGHTPGCCMIEVEGTDVMFSGDFLFSGSVGRWDFPYSDAAAMLKSLEKCQNLQGEFTLYPGHGEATTLSHERQNLDAWIRIIRRELG